MKNTELMVLWESRIRHCKSSGQKVTAWCLENGVSKCAYYYWHRKIKQSEHQKQLPKNAVIPAFAKIPSETVSKLVPEDHLNSKLTISWNNFSITVRDLRAIPMAAELMTRLETPC